MPALDLVWLAEKFGDNTVNTTGGLVIGMVFGVLAQRSRFCLRAATVEFWRGQLGHKTAIWLLVFGTALLGTQLLFSFDQLREDSVRQLTQTGTVSGAIIGGLMFGVGMVLAGGCASRLLVLSATGNLRALLAGLILTLVAQASLRGVLSPVREDIGLLWMVEPRERNMMTLLPEHAGLVTGVAILLFAFVLCRNNKIPLMSLAAALGVGATVALSWWFTSALSQHSFDVVTVQSISFTGPSTDTLMAFINQPELPLSFGIGLVPGVFIGSLVSAVLANEFKLQSFDEDAPLPRYITGAALMGFGSMLAGGCAVGAGVSGGAVLAMTSWLALAAMWIGAGLADLAIDRKTIQVNLRNSIASARV